MNVLKFKTNINCSGCVASVTPALSGIDKIDHWNVDTESEDKILKAEGTGLDPKTVIDTLDNVGFTAILISQN